MIQGVRTCSAIDEASRSPKAIQKRVITTLVWYDIRYWDKHCCFCLSWAGCLSLLGSCIVASIISVFVSITFSLCSRLLYPRHAAVESSRNRGDKKPALLDNVCAIQIKYLYNTDKQFYCIQLIGNLEGDFLTGPHPCSGQKWSKANQSTRGSFRWKISLNSSSGWPHMAFF